VSGHPKVFFLFFGVEKPFLFERRIACFWFPLLCCLLFFVCLLFYFIFFFFSSQNLISLDHQEREKREAEELGHYCHLSCLLCFFVSFIFSFFFISVLSVIIFSILIFFRKGGGFTCPFKQKYIKRVGVFTCPFKQKKEGGGFYLPLLTKKKFKKKKGWGFT